ncbi:unnamed protein product [Parnassius apollo]|uniref:(apollo) hypothetical protein n=1 Tax=Parnassius apollo TaxID=110799 RepID=A0A8S3XP97_PARAO|nr:unnamed protein product [Parnassius apollo]
MPSGTGVCSLRAAAVRVERCRVVRVCVACALQLCAWSDAEWYVCVQPARCSCARGAMPSGTGVCSLRAAAVRVERCRVVRVCAACALQLCAWSDAEWYVCVQPARCSCARGAMPSGTGVCSLRAAAVRVERCRVVRVCVACALQLCAWSDAECLGYKPFMMAISNQVPFLTSIINTRERRVSMVKNRVRTPSTGSLNLDIKPQQTVVESKVGAAQKVAQKAEGSPGVHAASGDVPPPAPASPPPAAPAPSACALM